MRVHALRRKLVKHLIFPPIKTSCHAGSIQVANVGGGMLFQQVDGFLTAFNRSSG